MRRQFVKLLKESGAWKNFIENLQMENFTRTFDNFMAFADPKDYFVAAFRWEDTKQGKVFWALRDAKWQQILKRNKVATY